MANELTVNLTLQFLKGNVSIRKALTDSITVAGARGSDHIQSLTAGASTLVSMAGVAPAAVPGMLLIQNLDATNYVELSMDTAFAVDNVFAKLLAGQFCIFPPKLVSTLYAKANTGDCNIMTTAIEL